MSDIYKSCPIIENERFWHSSYEKGWFIRWSVTDKAISKVTGTIELFRREAEDAFNEAGVLHEGTGICNRAYGRSAEIRIQEIRQLSDRHP